MIKKILFATMLIISSISITKAQQLNYQGIARNANGVAISFQDVSIRLSIRDLIALGSTLYSETRLVRTNQFGLINVVIGSPGAINTIGSIGAINWAGSSKFLQVEIDPLGGTSFQNAGTSQLQSVPYAFFANAAYPVGPAGGDLLGSTYPNPIIAPLVVTTTKLADSAVITRKIADMAVTTEKIMDSAVTTTKLRDKGVTTEKIADSAITNEKIKNGAITNEKITDGTIQNIKLVNSIITLNGLVLNLGGSQSFVVDSAGTDVNIASANSIHRFNFPNASIINRGLITTTTQTIGGNKIFNNNITAASFIRNGGIAAQFLKADGSVDNKIYLSANQPIIFTATGDATGISTSSGTAPVLPLTLATVNSTIGTFGTNILIPAITVNNKGLVTNIITNPIPTATSTTLGLLTATDWNTFNSKQNVIPLGTTAQYFRGDLSLSNFQTDIRAQLSAGTNITYTNGQFSITNNSVTLNNLPLTLGGSQTFATGTGGIDFNISSLGTVHTFNIPTASVFARGLLTTTDYTNFNAAYSNRITSLTTNGPNGVATLGSNVLNIPTYALPAATGTTLGGTIIGANISNSGGTISLNNTNITNALGSQSGNLIFASPNGSAGTPVFRPMATSDIPDNIVTNIKLANSSFNLGTTNIALGTTAGTITGLTSVTSSSFLGPLTGNANTASTLVNPRLIYGNSFDGSANVTGTISDLFISSAATWNAKEGAITSGTNLQYWRGDKTFQILNTTAVPEGINLYYTEARVNANTNVASNTAARHNAVTIGTANGLSLSTQQLSLGLASTSTTGALTSTDWNTFNAKQATLTNSSGLAGALSDETGTGLAVFATNPILIAPALGTPTALVGTNITGTAAGLSIGGNAATATSAVTATNIAAGSVGQLPYQSAAGTTSMLAIGSSGQILTLTAGLLPSWSTPASNNQWSILGNAGLNAGTNFLGTTDAVALQFKVQGIFAGQIHPTGLVLNTSFGLGSNRTSDPLGVRNSAFGAGALASNEIGVDNTAIGQGTLSVNVSGSNNTAVGQSALLNTIGFSNTAVGQAAMQLNTSGFNNTAMGKDALYTNSSGENNTAIGHFAAQNLTLGSRNTALGQNSLSTTTTGNDNVGLGYNARVSAGISNSVSIGSGANVTSNSSVAIGVDATNNVVNSILLGGATNTLVSATGALTATGRITATGARFAYRFSLISTTLTINDYYLKMNNNFAVIFPDATTMAGQKFVIFNGTGVPFNNFAFTGAQSIIGAGWLGTLGTDGSLSLFSDGANWLIEARN